MIPALNTVKYQAFEQSKQDNEKTHAALAKAEDRGEDPRLLKHTLSRFRCLISLPECPVVERSSCAHDNNMHTCRSNSGRRPKKCKKAELGPPKSTHGMRGWTKKNRKVATRFLLPGLMVHPNLQSSNSREEKEEKKVLSNNEMLRIGVDHWTKTRFPLRRLPKNQVHPPTRRVDLGGPVSGDLT